MNTIETLLGASRAKFRTPLAAGAGTSAVLSMAVRREASLAWTRSRSAGVGGRPLVAQRMPAPRLAGGLREDVRRHLGAGWITSSADAPTTLLAQVLADAGARPASTPAVGADGSVRLRVAVGDVRAVLRIGAAHTAEDPRRARRALQRLQATTPGLVPRPLRAGRVGNFGWTTETLLPGTRPARLHPALVRSAAAFTATLPGSSTVHSPTAPAAVLLDAVPGRAEQLRALAHRIAGDPLSQRPVLRHGDFWLGNCLLSPDGRLSGVVDWDAWKPSGLPGGDLLHLLATDERLRRRVPLGTVWLGSPWNSEEFVSALRVHWPEWAGDPAVRRTIGLDWWLHHVAADVTRVPGRALDEHWVDANITRVLDAVGG